MTVNVEYTAQLRVKTGMASESISLAEGACIKDLLDTVAGQHDIQEFLAGSLLCFVGSSQADPSQQLAEGDRITLLTPISGG